MIADLSTSEEEKRRAYLEGIKLMKSGLDKEVIYARLEKQGIKEDIIQDVIKNLFIQKKVDQVKNLTPFYNIALVRIGAGVGFAILFYAIDPSQVIVPIGLIGGGIISAFLIKKDMDA
jgi:hypothetical protein